MSDRLPPTSSVLAVCAHPDDESFGLGAILTAFGDAGSRLSVLCFTHGEASTLGGARDELRVARADELTAAGKVLGVRRLDLLDYPDGGLAGQPLEELGDHVARFARAVDATTLLTFDDGGITGHPDHQRATDAARHAASSLQLPLLAWTIPDRVAHALNDEFATTFAGRGDGEVDITLTVDRTRQIDAIRCHRTQAANNPVLWRRLELLGPEEVMRYLT